MDPELVQLHRAVIGVLWGAFLRLHEDEPDQAKELVGSAIKLLMAHTDLELPPSTTQFDRLMEEGVLYLTEHPIPTW